MQPAKWIKSVLSYLPVLAMLVLAATGIVVAKDLYQTLPASPVQNTTQVPPVQNSPLPPVQNQPPPIEKFDPQWLAGEMGTCMPHQIYTSLPPKCMTSNGDLIPVPGTWERVFVIPVTPESK
jgi:hypothetical protein